jgi:hypothetical protein
MGNRIVVVESPYAGATARQRADNAAYLAAALKDCLDRGEAPFASHGLYTLPGVLDDDIPEEREAGIAAGLQFHHVASKVAVYTDLGVSNGMQRAVEYAQKHNIPVVFRNIGAPHSFGGN